MAATVLAVFYPSVSAELNSIDDMDMVTGLLNLDHWRLKDVFIPRAGEGLYYRPLLSLSFLLDKELWFMQGSFMHLENILLHLCSSILVYFLTLKLLPATEQETSYLPLIAALCFGLHPLSTEPVSWVSGRTDVMAGTFVLLSAISLVKFKLEHGKKFLFFSVIALLLGMLSKEVALAFLPGAFFILMARSPLEKPGQAATEDRHRHKVKQLLLCGAIVAGSALLFFLLRSHAFTSNSPRIKMTLNFIFNDPDHAFFVFIKTFGFYMKKLYWPFPLNFAIVEVDPLYELLALPIIMFCVFIALRRTIVSAIFLTGVFLVTPALLIAFNQVAWTPYAERYIYIASAFVIIATVLFFGRLLKYYRGSIPVRVAVPCLVIVIGAATLQRNMVWKTNLSLYGDTVKKSPDFTKTWNALGVAYYLKKDLPNAEICFARASSLYQILGYDEKSDLNLAAVLFEQGKIKETEQVYARILKNSQCKSEKILEHYVQYLGERGAAEKDPDARIKIKRSELAYNVKMYDLTGKPLVLFRMGELSQDLGDKQSALDHYRKAYDKLPPDDKYKKIILKRLAQSSTE